MPASSSTPTGSLSHGSHQRAETPSRTSLKAFLLLKRRPPSRPRPSRLLRLANTKAAPLCHRCGGGADRFRLIAGGGGFGLRPDKRGKRPEVTSEGTQKNLELNWE